MVTIFIGDGYYKLIEAERNLPPPIKTYTFTGLPLSLVNGSGQISVECVGLDGAIQVANNVPLLGLVTAAVPLSINLHPNQTYKFHVVADYESGYTILLEDDHDPR